MWPVAMHEEPTFRAVVCVPADVVAPVDHEHGLVKLRGDAFSQHGAKVTAFYSMMGQYDSMFIVEAPNDDVMAQLALTVGAQGNVRTETHRAFNEDEYRKIVKNIP